MMRWVSWVSYGVGAGALALACYVYWAPAGRPVIAETEIEREITGAVAGTQQVVVFQLHNAAGRPVRVCGIGQC